MPIAPRASVRSLLVAALVSTSFGCRTTPAATVAPEPAIASPSSAGPPTTASPSLALGLESRYACIRRDDGLWCWGSAVVLPEGETGRPEGLMSVPLAGVEAFAIGSERVCTVVDGRLRCFGHDDFVPSLSPAGPVEAVETVPGLLDVAEVRIHDTTVCARERSGRLSCWTHEVPLEGSPMDEHHEEDPDWMERHDLADDVLAFAVGEYFACAVRAGGRLECWGSDPAHVSAAEDAVTACYEAVECEDESVDDCSHGGDEHACEAVYEETLADAWAEPMLVEDVPEPVEVAAGNDFACVRTKAGRVLCWGEGSLGQLGRGAANGSPVPVEVQGIDDVVKLAAGWTHACAVLADGRVACWGHDRLGAVGSRTSVVATPQVVAGIVDAVDVVLAGDLSCAVLREGTTRCWGHDRNGRIRGGQPPPLELPAVPLSEVTHVMPLGRDTCATRANGSVWCWGRHELGSTPGVAAVATPRPTPHDGLVQLLAGACARTAKDELRCWRSTAEMHEGGPTTLVVANAVAADADKDHACAVSREGQVRCWPQVTGKAPTPVLVGAVKAAVDVTVGPRHACAVLRDGAVDCWLRNAIPSATPVRLPALADAVKIVSNDAQACVRTRTGRVRCWAWDELDRPSFDHAIEGVEALTAGKNHLCALAKGQAWCWGHNGMGQVGSTPASKSVVRPQRVPGVDDATALAAGDEHTCARTRDGQLRCWGRDDEGQLGRLPAGLLVEPTPLLAAEDAR